MISEVKVPAMGESVTSGILASWKVKDGETVTKGQPIYDLETDKITSEAFAEEGGIITLKAKEGDTVNIGDTVASIEVGAGESPSPEPAKESEAPKTAAAVSAPTEAKAPADQKFAPSVEKLFEVSGIKPENVTPTGPKGNITKADAMSAAGMGSQALEGAKRVKMTPLRKKIAERLVGAQHQAAMLTTFNEVDMSAVMELRKQHKDTFLSKHGVKLGFMSFFIKATVEALKAIPQITAQIDGDEMVYPGVMDVGVAVSTPRGLMVPVLRGCEKMDFADIEKALGDIAGKARDGKITLDALQGGVFTITNGGIFGSMMSTPILNAPQSAILGMHAIKERPVAVNGQVVIRPMMYLALSYDHRVVDGKEAVTTLVTMKNALENPVEVLGFEG